MIRTCLDLIFRKCQAQSTPSATTSIANGIKWSFLYANLKLTKQTGKLPAIAGITRQVQVRIADTYLAGLWERVMQRGLHWWCDSQGVMVRPSIPRAPSWSWASLDLTIKESLVPSSADFYLCATHASKYIPYEHDLTLMSFSPELTEHGRLGSSLALTLRGLQQEPWRSAWQIQSELSDAAGSEGRGGRLCCC